MDRSVRVILSAEVAKFQAGYAKAIASSEKLGKTLTENHEAAGRVAGGLAAVGAVAAVGFIAAVKAYADYDEALSAVAATGDDARQNLDALGEAALEAGARTKYSAVEAARGVEALLKAGVSAEDVLAGGLAGSLDLAAASGMDVADAAEVMSTSMAQFTVQGGQAAHVADLLAAGAGKSVGEVSDLAMGLKQSGTVAAQFGISIEETVGSLALFAKNSLIGSDAGTSFRQMLLQLASPTDEAQAVLDEYNISAYTAQGRFVGMADLADQLRDKLGGLSQEQQNAALKTIFGADAIRTSTVLMKEGGDAVREWTQAVDDQGFAGEMAATKMGNLKGDLEQLGGSLETFGVRMGAQADGPMRGFVQGLTALVNAAADADPALQGVAMAALGSVAGVGLLGGGTLKLVTVLGEAKTAAAALGWSLKGITISAGAIGLALTVAGIAFGKFAQEQADAQQATEDYTAALKTDTGVLGENTRAAIANRLEKAGALKAAQDLGIGLATVTNAALGEADAMDKVRAAAGPLADDYTSVLDAIDYSNLSAAAQERARAAADLERILGKEASALIAGREEYERETEAAKANVDATDEVTTSHGGALTAIQKEAAAAKEARDRVSDYTAALFDNADAILALSGSEIGYQRAIDNMTSSIKENGKTLTTHTEAGRQNREALNNIASSAQNYIQKLIETGASADEVAEATKNAREAFIKAAIAAGMGADKAKKLADNLGLIPKRTVAAVEVNIKQPNIDREMALIQRRINANPLYVPIRAKGTVARAQGGYVRGPGTTTSDSILAALSDKEYVLRAWAVERLGLARLDHMNRYGSLPAFADGGYTGTRYGPSDPTPIYINGGGAPAAQVAGGITRVDLIEALQTLVREVRMAPSEPRRTVMI